MKYRGDIHISFLEPIMPGKVNDDFLSEIENKIYSEIKKYHWNNFTKYIGRISSNYERI